MKLTCLLLVSLSCIICFGRHAKGARILGMFPLQGKSHFAMFKEVLKSLANAGHQVDVVSHFPLENAPPNYTDIISLRGTGIVVHNSMTYELLQSISSAPMQVVIKLAGNDVCESLGKPEMQNLIKNPPTDPPYDLVITELFFASCYFAFGRHLKVPVIGLSSATIMPQANAPLGNPLNTAIVSEISDRPASHMNFRQRLTNTLTTVYTNLQSRYYMKAQNDMVKKYFGPDMPDVEELERDMSLLLVNTHPIFHGIRPLTPAVVEVPGLHIHDEHSTMPVHLMKWLDDSSDGFIYFSFGSMIQFESFPSADVVEMYAAFAKVAPLRVLLKVADPDKLPPGCPDNVLHLPWVPQVQVLKHENIRGFITHGGLMGLQEAVAYAVPLIGIPLFGDQMSNINICVERGIAVRLNYMDLKADKIVAAIKTVTQDPKYKKNMDAASKQFLDRPKSPHDTAVFWIEYILKHGADSLRSPAIKLTWWQVALLDVYGSVLAALLLVLYAFKIIFFCIVRRAFRTGKMSPLAKKTN
ncbi:UDP-glucosyltransferase 2-like isoform X1 [Neodiprion virginianus]|uniref:UDP-glucosyltransferase 2-like isoform X1 n=1 Tax=Neodiprion virginianus TaxID=2961670 RepID=UPI001EE728B6|nr:UDP-glucosyltransferase 2-like isoform X1 [Neodiprion virginianus]